MNSSAYISKIRRKVVSDRINRRSKYFISNVMFDSAMSRVVCVLLAVPAVWLARPYVAMRPFNKTILFVVVFIFVSVILAGIAELDPLGRILPLRQNIDCGKKTLRSRSRDLYFAVICHPLICFLPIIAMAILWSVQIGLGKPYRIIEEILVCGVGFLAGLYCCHLRRRIKALDDYAGYISEAVGKDDVDLEEGTDLSMLGNIRERKILENRFLGCRYRGFEFSLTISWLVFSVLLFSACRFSSNDLRVFAVLAIILTVGSGLLLLLDKYIIFGFLKQIDELEIGAVCANGKVSPAIRPGLLSGLLAVGAFTTTVLFYILIIGRLRDPVGVPGIPYMQVAGIILCISLLVTFLVRRRTLRRFRRRIEFLNSSEHQVQ
jgi:hypothetical protein